MPRRVQYSQLGGPEVLQVVEVEIPLPALGEVRVRILAAGLNPMDAKLFQGRPTSIGRAVQLPSGNGSDLAGVIDEVGSGVTEFRVGDGVFGGSMQNAQADFAIAKPSKLLHKPNGLTMEQAGSLDIVGRTGWATVNSLGLGPNDVVLVSAAAGGVGVVASQLARRAGATVIGSAGASNHDFLRSIGVIPVEYGPGLVNAVRAISPRGITAALDNHGRQAVDAAIELGAPPARINSIADYAAPADYGTTAVGGSSAGTAELLEVAELVAAGELQFPIDSIFPLERVSAAYERLLGGHLRGKIVLLT